MRRIIIADLAACRGAPGSRFEHVMGLSWTERDAVKKGALVLVRPMPGTKVPDFNGAKFMKAIFRKGRYTYRPLTAQDIKSCGGESWMQ